MHIKTDFKDIRFLVLFFISPYSFIFTSLLIIASITTNRLEQRENLSQELQRLKLFNSTLNYSQVVQILYLQQVLPFQGEQSTIPALKSLLQEQNYLVLIADPSS